MSCDVGELTERLENEQSFYSWDAYWSVRWYGLIMLTNSHGNMIYVLLWESKGKSFTANAGTKVPDLLGTNRCGSFSLLSAPQSISLASEQTLEDPRGTNVEVRRMDLANWALRTSPKFTKGVKCKFHPGFLSRSEIRKSQSPFASVKSIYNIVNANCVDLINTCKCKSYEEMKQKLVTME